MSSASSSGRVALVTGGSRGIGRAIALELSRRGAAVAINYRSRPELAEEVAREIVSAGGRAITVQADVGVEEQVRQMADRVADELGPADILVNNAGILLPGTILDHRESEFDQMWRIHVKGTIYCCQAVAPGMLERGWGRVINLSSNAAVGTSMPGTTLYAATKGAVLTLTRRMALEWGERNVTANAVLPGFTKTDMTLGDKSDEQQQAVIERISNLSMLRRVGQPEEIAAAVGFLASDESSFMTGQFLLVDGGRIDYLAQT